MHTESPCAEELLEAETKMPPRAQKNWNKSDRAWSKSHPCLEDHSLERDMVSAQKAWQSESTSPCTTVLLGASLSQTLMSWAAQPAQYGWWLCAIKHRRQQLKFCLNIRFPLKMLGTIFRLTRSQTSPCCTPGTFLQSLNPTICHHLPAVFCQERRAGLWKELPSPHLIRSLRIFHGTSRNKSV